MKNYLTINKALWNEKTAHHLNSEFYGLEDFKKGKDSLIGPEESLLKDIKGKSILHLQCHFGQDSISLARRGAKVTGIDLSDQSIEQAKLLNDECGTDAEFICCDVYSTPQYVQDTFDIVYTSYGTIGWLPDVNEWAKVIADRLKVGGELIFADFHPVVWMHNSEFNKIEYSYFNIEPIVEENEGTYADREAEIKLKEIGWNHSLSDVIAALIEQGLSIKLFKEYDYSPYNCFRNTVAIEDNKFQIKGLENKLPMMYVLVAQKLN